MPSLADLGWNPFFESHRRRIPPSHVPARVAAQQRGLLSLLTERGPLAASVSGRLEHEASSRLDLPAVGDWVAARVPPTGGQAVIDAVLPRTSCFTRQAAGRRVEPQVVAANVDAVGVVTSADLDFNPRRLERYLALTESSGAVPVLVLNKVDLCDRVPELLAELKLIAPLVPIVAASAVLGEGVDALRRRIRPGQTFAFVGSSGVGKSSLVNTLLGRAVQATGAVREHDDRGRHVTTHRELFVLEGGGLVVDTPGMRELQAWAEEDGASGWTDVEDLAAACRFGDCRHEAEPGCAVLRAAADGRLPPERLEAWRKIQRELAYQARRQDVHLQAAARREWKLRSAVASLKLRRR